MRNYRHFPEALNEIRRDVAEMGIRVHPHSWQDKWVKDNPEFESLELQNYIYCVTQPRLEDLNPTQPWADLEWGERLDGIVSGIPVNPGEAWKSREQVWKQFLNEEGKFGYSYSERFSLFQQVQQVISRIKSDPDSRQLFISVWNPEDSTKLGGVSRVPCTLGYQIQVRNQGLHLTYLQRSADLVTHFENDLYLACKMQHYISQETGVPIGRYTHWIASLHMFRKDSEGIF
jgi:thymidylate synthase